MPRVYAPIGTPVQFYGAGDMSKSPYPGVVAQAYKDGRHDIAIFQTKGTGPVQVRRTVFHEGDPSLKEDQFGPAYVEEFGLFRLPEAPRVMSDEQLATEKEDQQKAAEQRQQTNAALRDSTKNDQGSGKKVAAAAR